MASSQRPGEITYYEELGVESTASSDEIRDSFRALARLLHPDAQTDPQLKEMAEQQMRKLNRIYAVLSDPVRRTAYDDSLNDLRPAPIIVFSGGEGNLKRLLARIGAAAGILVGTVVLVWLAIDNTGSNEVRGQESRGLSSGKANEGGDGETGDQIAQLRARIHTLETERNSALAQLSRLSGKPLDSAKPEKTVAVNMAAPTTATSLNDLSSTVRTPGVAVAPANSPAEVAASAAQFTGSWAFQKAAGSASPGGKAQYPPEYIELTMTAQSGTLHGQYRSRYQVLDHAISPDVEFTFNASPSGNAAATNWQGPGGARGKVTLKLLSAGDMQVTWNATELGSQQWLVSGDATLTKK